MFTKANILKSKLLLLLLLLSFSAVQRAHCFTLSSRVHEFNLKNGLKIILLERHSSPTISFSMCFKTGSVDEKSGTSGIAHLLEHMLFKGTKTIGTTDYRKESKILKKIDAVGEALDTERKKGKGQNKDRILKLRQELKQLQQEHEKLINKGEIDSIYSRNGAVGLNASTGFGVTTYKVSLPSNRLELWARIESDRFSNPVFRQFYSERNVVLEEHRQSYETKPGRMLMTQLLASAFTAHPYGRPIIGWKSDIQYLSKKVTEDFFKSRYSLGNAVLSIVGDIQIEETKKVIKKYFEGIPTYPIQETHITREPEQMGERRVSVRFDAEPKVLIGYHKPTIPDFDDYVFDLIDGLLSSGRTSRLYRSLVLDKKIATSVETFNGFPDARYPNLFVIKVFPSHAHSCKEVENAVYDEIEKLKHGQISRKELRKVKNQFKVNFIRRLQSNAGLAGILSYYQAVCNDWRYLEKHLEVIDKITQDDIQMVAQKYLNKKNRTVAYLVKENE